MLEPRFGLYFLCLLLFAAAAALQGDYWLAGVELVVILVLYLFYRRSTARRRKEAERYLEKLAGNVDLAAKDTMLNCPMPVVMVQKALKKSAPAELDVLVDNQTALENVTRFAGSQGYQVDSAPEGADFRLHLHK